MVIILDLSHPIVWLIRHVYLFFLKQTFGLSDMLVITVIAENRTNSVGSLFFRDRILRFGTNMLQSLKRFLTNFNVVAIQNSLDGFRNTLNVGNNSKTSRWFPLIRSATSCNWFFGSYGEKFPISARSLWLSYICVPFVG